MYKFVVVVVIPYGLFFSVEHKLRRMVLFSPMRSTRVLWFRRHFDVNFSFKSTCDVIFLRQFVFRLVFHIFFGDFRLTKRAKLSNGE